MTRIRLAAWGVAAAAAAIVGLAACGGGGDGGEPDKSSVPTEVPSDLPTEVPTSTPSGGAGTPKPGKLPEGFPLPKGAKKGDFSDNAGNVAGTVTVTDGAKAYDYWTGALPKAGYKITSKSKVEFNGTKSLITFNGEGYSNATITINDKTAAISLQK